jgi:integrase
MGVTVPRREADGSEVQVPMTLHGFRSSSRSWAEECGYGSDPRLIEFALAHKLPERLDASYVRVTRVEERRAVMERSAAYCYGEEPVAGNIVSLRAAN